MAAEGNEWAVRRNDRRGRPPQATFFPSNPKPCRNHFDVDNNDCSSPAVLPFLESMISSRKPPNLALDTTRRPHFYESGLRLTGKHAMEMPQCLTFQPGFQQHRDRMELGIEIHSRTLRGHPINGTFVVPVPLRGTLSDGVMAMSFLEVVEDRKLEIGK